MSILSAAIGKRIRELGLAQKDVAVAFHGALVKLAKKGEGVDFKTVPPKISKLLKGSPEGESFVFASEARVAAMAEALKWKPQHLRSLGDSSRAHRVLVLHPNLRYERRDFLKRQAEQIGASYSCVEVTVSGDDSAAGREALRRAAEANPGCLVVMDADDDLDYYAGAKIEVTKLERRPRGWSLVADRELVPQPPPDPPLTNDADGMPMANPPGFLAELEAEIEKYGESANHYWGIFDDRKVLEAARAAFVSAREVEREPTFRIDHLFGWIRRDVLPQAKLRIVALKAPAFGDPKVDVATADVMYAALTGTPEETLVWTHKGRAFALGPNQKALSGALNLPGDPVPMPASLRRLGEYLPRGNPWQPERKRWKQLCAEVAEECGVDMAAAYDRWLDAADQEKREREISEVTHPRASRKPARAWTIRLGDGPDVKKARAQLQKLLRREFSLEWHDAHQPFVLEAIVGASLIALPIEGHDVAHVVANLGAGNVVRIRVMRFFGEQAEPLRPTDAAGYRSQLDGGDVHVWIQAWCADLLDGQPLSRVLRRREEEGRPQVAIDDDDD